ncbi:DUF300-domain-containing protein [Sesbania bispinosa]|nr:DUF300-domain-containing protein [Sesbania bispinosa]
MTETTSFCQPHSRSDLRSPSPATSQQLWTPVVAGAATVLFPRDAAALFVHGRLCSVRQRLRSRRSSSGNVSGRRSSCSSGNVSAVCSVSRPSFCSRTTEEKMKKRKDDGE